MGYNLTDIKSMKNQLTPVPDSTLEELTNYVCMHGLQISVSSLRYSW